MSHDPRSGHTKSGSPSDCAPASRSGARSGVKPMTPSGEEAPGPRAVLIAGPTGSGKSQLALALAEASGSLIVNADSMQVYEGLRILTARPQPAEEARLPHRLYGFVPPSERYSVGRWLRAAADILGALRPDSPPVLFVGGTGLYFKALTEGLVELPELGPMDRERLATLDDRRLHAELARRDARAAARLAEGDRQRVARALQVVEETGRSLLDWQKEAAEPLLPPSRSLRIVLDLDRPTLYGRIDARFESMMRQGALAEVAALLERRLDPSLPLMKAVGLPPLARHLRGDLDKAEAVGLAQRDSRRYAKRQLTFFRNQFRQWRRLGPADALAVIRSWMRGEPAGTE